MVASKVMPTNVVQLQDNGLRRGPRICHRKDRLHPCQSLVVTQLLIEKEVPVIAYMATRFRIVLRIVRNLREQWAVVMTQVLQPTQSG